MTAEKGKEMVIRALVTDPEGNTVEGVVITFLLNGEKIGEDATGPDGYASITYTPRKEGSLTLEARMAILDGKVIINDISSTLIVRGKEPEKPMEVPSRIPMQTLIIIALLLLAILFLSERLILKRRLKTS